MKGCHTRTPRFLAGYRVPSYLLKQLIDLQVAGLTFPKMRKYFKRASPQSYGAA